MFLQEHERFLRSMLITHFKSSRRGESRLFTLHGARLKIGLSEDNCLDGFKPEP